jgi:Lon protease-like protein
MKPKRIPLFPLDVVLFPGIVLPLHIFEPRYKQMIRICLLEKRHFGVILAEKERISTTGCTAAIVNVVRQSPDGQMDILTRGESAFLVKEVFDEKPYYEALVDYIEGATAPFPSASNELMEIYEQCHWLLFNRAPDSMPVKPAVSPAYWMASTLPLDLDEKQALLEMRDETERQHLLLENLKEWIPQLVHLNERRERARGNGHSLN